METTIVETDGHEAASTNSDTMLESRGSCAVRFALESGHSIVDLRFVAAYNDEEGAFSGPSENVDCSFTDVFEWAHAENYSGVLQVQAANRETFTLVNGPADIATCNFAYRFIAPTASDFLLQVQAARTITPVVITEGLPTLSVMLDCHDE
ncbi:MAG TPA: hypothetical protein VEL28_19265 [Candidatus Binatia bacterium]|nr:hypothetical protein [Candidatus Binatia bacterium]